MCLVFQCRFLRITCSCMWTLTTIARTQQQFVGIVVFYILSSVTSGQIAKIIIICNISFFYDFPQDVPTATRLFRVVLHTSICNFEKLFTDVSDATRPHWYAIAADLRPTSNLVSLLYSSHPPSPNNTVQAASAGLTNFKGDRRRFLTLATDSGSGTR